MPADSILLYVSITGSRAKGIFSSDSDYDTRTIILQPMKKYFLQRAKENFEIDTNLKDGTKVEGTGIDILKAFKYCQKGHVFLYETFGGIPIYETEISNKIKEIW